MTKLKQLKYMLCLILALVCNVAWAQITTIQSSTSVDSPEYKYELKTAANYWMNSNTSPTSTTPGKFAFFAVKGQDGAFKVYSVDQQKWVSYEKSDSYANDSDKAILVDSEENANAWNATESDGYFAFAPYKNDGAAAVIYWNWYGGVGSNTDKTIGLYDSKTDNGSKWTLYAYEAATDEDLTNAKSVIKVAPGYPKTSASAYSALDGFTLPSSKAFLDAAVTAYKTCNDVILPTNGKAYTIANYSLYNGETKRYVKYSKGELLSATSTNPDDASIFVCRELSDGVYVFVTEDGKFLTWPHSGDGFKGDGSYKGYSNNYATEYEGYSDWNKITVKKNGSTESDFGHLRLVARRYYTADKASAPNSSFIIRGDNGNWDRAGDSYFLKKPSEDSKCYSSAWILTEVAHTNTDAQNVALAKIDAKLHVAANSSKLGEGIGYAYYIVGGEKKYTTADINTAIDAATTVDAVNAIKNSYAIMLPEIGKAYTMTLVANNNEKSQYKIIATNDKLEAKTEGENSVFYCLQSSSNDYPYIFVSEDGYVLGYKKLVSEYYRTDNRHNFKVEGMYDKSSGYITSAATDRLGMVCITTAARNADDGTGGVGCLIFNYTANSTTAWDNSSAPYHNGTYTSAIIMAEVENYSVPTAQQTKIDAILGKDALKTQVEAIRNDLKNQPGYYYCTIGGEKVYDADAIIAAIDATQSLKTLNEISTAVAGKTLIVPEVGKYYRLKGKTSGNYIDASGQNKAQMNMKEEPDYLGSIFLLDEGSKWLNMSTGTYVYNTHSIGEAKANANTWTFILASTGYFKVKSNYSSPWLHDSGNKANRCQNDGSDHEFIIEEVKPITLTIDAPAAAGATATWNDETQALPATWAHFEGMTITNTALILNYDNVNYTFGGLYEGEEQVELPATIAELPADRKFTAKFTPAFFSASTAEKDLVPVQIYNIRDKGYTICLNNAADYTDHAVNSGTTEYALNEVWYLVGNAESFKMYSHTAGMDLALTLAGDGSGSAATMTANGTELRLITKDDYYYITPKTNEGQSFNMNGGKGKDIKLFSATDGGSSWGINVMDIDHSLTYSVTVSGTPWDDRYGVGELTFDVKGIGNNTHITEAVAAQTCYLPKNATFTLSSIPYRGYTFSVSGGAENYEGTLAEGNLTIELSYTANEEKILYHSPSTTSHPYRIPAIATAPNGHIFAIADHRPCGNDIGYGEVDVMCRISKDNGKSWSEEFFIANGLGELPFLSEEDQNKTGDELNAAKATVNNMHIGFGDAAVVADRESNKLLVMMVAGRTVCHNGRWDKTKVGDTTATAVNRVARIYLTYNENTGEWDKSEITEMTDHMYSLFLNGETPTVTSMFIGSGKICQSRVVKKNEYYRLYCSIWTRDGGNRVIYSDDFGGSWNVLGTVADRPGPGGDEPKVEELPDGTVVLSSRVGGGRIFNLFTFNNEGKSEEDMYTAGSWGTAVQSNTVANGLSFGGNSTNGEIYKVKAIHKETGRICNLMLQSVPTGSGRSDVAVFYKELDADTYTPTTIAQGWTKGKHVSYKSSCYSTMIMQADGRLAFLFEEAPNQFCIVYIPYTIEDVTGGAYSLYTVNSTISGHGIGTFYASEAMQIPEGVKAYVATTNGLVMNGDDGYIAPTELEGIIPANTGAILMGDADTYNFIPSISYGNPVEDNMLVGYEAADNKAESKSAVTLPEGSTVYVLAVKNEVAGFYKKEADFNVYNNKAYLNVPGSAGARAIYFDFGGETGILETENGDVKTENCYDLSGRRVVKAQKGIYIVNGKKVVY